MADDRLKWTADELLAELRRRERALAAHGGGAKRARAALPAPPGRSRDMQQVPTGRLAALAREQQRGIYGVDGRKDLYQVTAPKVRAAAQAVVALVKAADLKPANGGGYKLATTSYRDGYDLCGNEPFVSQPLGCFCSGFLVAPDVIATAGHCVDSQADLANIRFVFDFRMIDADKARTTFPARDVYRGVKLLGRRLDANGTDWALVRLDRAVEGRKPLKIRTTGKIANSQSVFVIGHPCGLPQKYAPGAKVRHNSPVPYFVANLDTYGGNSGSPVFNASNGNVEGILVRGDTDFVSNGTCNVSMVCPSTGCKGEDVTRATVWAASISKTTSGAAAAGGVTKARKPGARKAGTKRAKSGEQRAARGKRRGTRT